MVPEIALAASARDWPDRLHRFLLDHGGGRVRAQVMGAEQALGAEFDLILIDDICSFLTPRLVRRLREQGKGVLGVFSPEDGPDAKRRLLECGISDVIESDAAPEEFIAAMATTMSHQPETPVVSRTAGPSSLRVAVFGATTGVGCTELAVAVASGLSSSVDTVLVDLDQTHPGVAQRLDLPLHPNLRTAIDLAHHEPGRLAEAVLSSGRLHVIGGLATPASESVIPRVEVDGLLEDLEAIHAAIVLDIGVPAGHVVPHRIPIIVGEASPVGVGRLIRAADQLLSSTQMEPLIVVNRVPSDGHRRDDIQAELGRSLPGVAVVLLPYDRRLERAAWDGALVHRGPYSRSVRRIVSLLEGLSA